MKGTFVGIMLKKLAKCVREYKREAIWTLILMVGEAIIETLIPFVTATFLINKIQEQGKNLDMGYILAVGGVLVLMAVVSLTCGGLAGFTSARASAGFSKNLRHDIFAKIQSFSFSCNSFSSELQ